jgi:hypothetical protein
MKIIGIGGAIVGFILALLMLSFIICTFILKSIQNEDKKK